MRPCQPLGENLAVKSPMFRPATCRLLTRMAAKYDHKKKACLEAITDSIAVGENPLESMLGSC